MGIFSKIFKGNKLELQDDSDNDDIDLIEQNKTDNNNKKTISPFLMDDDEVEDKTKKD